MSGLQSAIKELVRWLLPSGVWNFLRDTESRLKPARLELAPQGWSTIVHGDWNDDELLAQRRIEWDRFKKLVDSMQPLGFSHEDGGIAHTEDLAFQTLYLIWSWGLGAALAGRTDISKPLRILDWGGALGQYALIARALYPEVEWDYTVKELPAWVKLGKELNPSVRFVEGDECLSEKYDLVLVNASIQYMPDWKSYIPKWVAAARSKFLLMRVPVVHRNPACVAIQRLSDQKLLHQFLNHAEVETEVARTGAVLIRRAMVGDRLPIRGLDECGEMAAWLFDTRKLNR